MAEMQRTESALTKRPLKERVLGQTRDVADLVERLPADAGAIEPDISTSIETIHRVTETYAVLLEKLSSYELRVRELSQALGAATLAKEEAQRAAAEAARELEAERARSRRAEAETAQSTKSAHELERQLTTLRAQTSKLMNAVDQMFPSGEDTPQDGPKGLRVVR